MITVREDPQLDASDIAKGFELIGDLSAADVEVLQQYCATDIAVANTAGLAIVQCKASGNPAQNPLTRGDVMQILVDGGKHLQRIRDGGDARPISRFILISNRHLGDQLSDLNTECSALSATGNFHAIKAPASLTGDPNSNQLLSDWAESLKDQKKIGDPQVDVALADQICQLLAAFVYVELSLDKCRAVFIQSMHRMGLMPAEITGVDAGLVYEMAQGTANGVSIADALKGRFFSEGFHTFCPNSLKPIEDAELSSLWDRTGIGGSMVDAITTGLPRRTLLGDVRNCLEKALNRSDSRPIVIWGDGGVGKTQLLFQIPDLVRNLDSNSGRSHVFGITENRGSLDPVESYGFDFYFRNYMYPRSEYSTSLLPKRLKVASEACGSETELWVLLPNADELREDGLTKLFSQWSNTNDLPCRLVLTSRTVPFSNLGRYKNRDMFVELQVGNLDRQELREWIYGQGLGFSGSQAPPRPTSPNAIFVTKDNRLDAIDLGVIDHPVAFQAMKRWLDGGPNPVDRLDRLHQFLQLGVPVLNEYLQSVRTHFCERVHKHVLQAGVIRDDIEGIYDRIHSQWQGLSSIMPGQWRTELCGDVVSEELARLVIGQFVQVGLIRYSNERTKQLEWSSGFREVFEVASQ